MRASRYAPAIAAAAMLSLVWSRASDAQGSGGDDQMERPEVRSLELRGVESVDRDELLQSIATSESSCKSLLLFAFCPLSHSSLFWDKEYLDRTELRRDVLRIRVFYWLRGFREAQVDTVVDRRGRDAVNVTFRVREGRPTLLRDVRVERRDSVLTEKEINSLLEVERGKPFNLVALDSTLLRIRGVLQNRGYPNARTDTATTTDTVARFTDVRITVDPGPLTYVGEIRITGNRNVSERTIRNSLSFKSGDLFGRRELSESQRRLYESGLFQRASISAARFADSAAIAGLARVRDSLREFGTQAQLDSLRKAFFDRLGDSTVRHIDVDVSEAPLRMARVEGGFNTFDFIQVDGRYTQHNFFGGARRLDVSGTVGNLFANQLNGSNIGGVIGFQDVTEDIDGEADEFLKPTYQASVDFTQPWLFSPRNSAGVGVFAYRRQAPAVFVERGEGTNISFTREVAERVPVSLAYRFELTGVRAGDVYFCVNYGVCDPQTIGALRTRQRLSPLQLTGFVNRRNDPLSPTRGYAAEARLEHASAFTGSSFRYNRVYVEGAAYRPIGSRAVLAGHARVGFVRALASTRVATHAGDELSGDILHPRTRLYAGGARSVRGVGENQLGPRVLTVPPSKLAVICPDLSGAAIAECDLSRTDTAGNGLADRDFTPRPLGGRALLEGSVELRFPVWRNIYGAAFVDGALLGQGSLESATKGAGAITPGIGVRYLSAVGPIRVDLGLNPTLPEELAVITQIEGPDALRIIELRDRWRYNPTGGASGITGILRRLTLHLSIGEAY
ncbi:MAG TPA: BamA/TamA family outer membrane protein [Gemmatimonadaceae bacterium]|jgi:outer membrane protein assembly factor BamA|nr:BamA/TamA family outer membrane protein [Gemmatimonadaceae bacterium]